MWGDLRNPGRNRKKKFSFYGTVGYLTCFSIDPRKLHSKIRKTHLSTAFWSWFLEIFKNKNFCFSQFSEILFKTISILWRSWLLDMFLRPFPKTALKIPKIHLSAAFWSWHSLKFSKIRVLIFLNFLDILFSDFLGSSGRLTLFIIHFRNFIPPKSIWNEQLHLVLLWLDQNICYKIR